MTTDNKVSDMSLTAIAEGMRARMDDEETGELTDNPHTPGTIRFRSWYEGYNHEE